MGLTGSGGSQPSLVVVAMAPGYYRIELNRNLGIDDVAACIAQTNLMIDFEADKAKETDGKVDVEGAHYSLHDWTGKVKLDHTAWYGSPVSGPPCM